MCGLSLNNSEYRELTAVCIGPFPLWAALAAGKLFSQEAEVCFSIISSLSPFGPWDLPELPPVEIFQGCSPVPMEAAHSLSVPECLHPSHSWGSSASSHREGLAQLCMDSECFVSNKTVLSPNHVSPSCHLVQPALFMNSSSPSAKSFAARGAELILWSGLHTMHNIFSFIYVKGFYPWTKHPARSQAGQGIRVSWAKTGLEISWGFEMMPGGAHHKWRLLFP